MRYISDRNIQRPVSAFMLACIDRVVEVFRIFAVDGDKRDIAHVLAANEVSLHDFLDKAPNLLLDRLRPLVGNIVTAQRNVYF